jgi:hypothetical protein
MTLKQKFLLVASLFNLAFSVSAIFAGSILSASGNGIVGGLGLGAWIVMYLDEKDELEAKTQ